ncbi:MAG: hypothetical protein A2428_05585 [Bdellovibrionales bacterium RIFOXYC1_FULL_54_43]|nr:MAG: hypothetical protein A2428_05585 [Bdellovibrionales bacterium RIFOXYC1_FULL_54_43]
MKKAPFSRDRLIGIERGKEEEVEDAAQRRGAVSATARLTDSVKKNLIGRPNRIRCYTRKM